MFYPVSYNRIIVGTAPGASFADLQREIAAALSIQPDSIFESYPGRQLLIKIGRDATKTRVLPLIYTVEAVNQVLYARPVFVSESGNYNSYGTDFIVDLKSTTTYGQLQQLMSTSGCTLAKRYPFQDDIYILAAGKDADYDALAAANLFYETGLFDYAEPDKVVYDAQHIAPNDPMFSLQWPHANSGSYAQYSGVPGADIKVQQAWEITMGKPHMKVGVIDAGVDLTHPDLQENLLQGFNGATLTSNPGDGAPLGPAQAHGTNCAGIIAAVANNNIGIAGIAPRCKIIPATIFGSTGSYLGDAAVAGSFDYCRLQGASVISNSWGGGGLSSTIEAAINRAVTLGRNGKGCVVLFSSGNGNTSVSYPASNPSVISVGGVTMCNERKSPSSCDLEYWWGANSGTGLDVVAPCVKIATTDIQGTGGYNTTAGVAGDYNNTFNGTSSACPNAAGVAALICSVDSNLTLAQVRQILESSCDKVPGFSFATNVAQPNGTWNSQMGYGRVNALSAVQLASTGQFCSVQIQAASLSYCNGTVGLSVVNPDPLATYQWKQAGALVGSGTSYNATAAAVYEAVMTKGSCTSTSSPLPLQPAVSLQPTAAPAVVCPGGSSTLAANATLVTNAPCIPYYASGTGSGDYISEASIATTTLNNTTTGAASPFYTVFPQSGASTATLTANIPYVLTVKGGTYHTCYIRAWIDYNRDGILTASESIGLSPNVGTQTAGTIAFTVPATALNGPTLLRLRSDDASPGPGTTAVCNNLGFGETEDYYITIAGATAPAASFSWASLPANGTLISTSGLSVSAANIPISTDYIVTAVNWAGCITTATVNVNAAHTWTGATSTVWNNSGNWSCGSVPPVGANIVIPVTANQPHLSSAVTIGKLDMAGVLNLNSNALTIDGAVSGAGAFNGTNASTMVINGPAGLLKFSTGGALLQELTVQPSGNASVDAALLQIGQ